jgi:hypothetical protein
VLGKARIDSIRNHGEESMMWQHARIALLANVVMATAAFSARAEEADAKAKAAPTPVPAATVAPAPSGACGGCGAAPAMQTICVQEWVPEHYQCTRTVQEHYTAYRTQCCPQQQTKCITVNRMVPEWREICKTVCVPVTVCEQRTVMKTVTVCKPVTTCTRKCVDQGHYECQCVPVKSFFSKSKCCDPCSCCCQPCQKTKMKKVWVPCKVWIETPCTKMVKCTECVPTVCNVKVCKMVPQVQKCRVCCYRCVPEQKTITCTVMVQKCVPYQACRTVTKCIPCQETFTACRMVCRTVQKQVPVCNTCCNTCCDSCCNTCCVSCCNSRCHKRSKHSCCY